MFFGTVVLRIPGGGTISREMANAPWSPAKLLDYLNHLWPPAVILGLMRMASPPRLGG
jgi:ABC-type dipeptide/oligopeptide/nickel transport system permease component